MRKQAGSPGGLPIATLLGAMLLAAAVLMAGCSVGPDYKAPEPDLPDSWNLAKDPAVLPTQTDVSQWWKVFDDPVLTGLISRAGMGNRDLMVAIARVKEARANVGVARGEEWPSLDAQGKAARQGNSENDYSGGQTYNNYSGSLEASWEIDLFGRIRRSVEAAKADYEASEEDRLDVMISLYAQVAQTYISVRALQARLAAARKNIQSQKEVLKLTDSRFRNGLATALDVSQADSILASSEAEIPPLRISLAQSINSVALLLGLHPGALWAELLDAKPIPIPPKSIAVGMPADLLRRRPDIRRSERQLAAATARIGVATADLYPSFSLTGSLGLSSHNSGDFFKSGSSFFAVGLPISWNIFSGGRVRSQIKVQDAQTEQALYNYEQSVLSALNEVENSLAAFLEQNKRVEALGRTVSASRRTLELAVKLYKDGLTDFQNVLDAQRSMFDYDNQLAAAKGESASNLVDLYKALGGGWKPAIPPSGKKAKEAQPKQGAKK